MENLDFLDGPEPAPTAAVSQHEPSAEAATPAPATDLDGSQPRGPDGKFLPKSEPAAAPEPVQAAQPAPQPAPVAAEAAPSEPLKAPDGYVPVSVVQEMRREIQALKQAGQQPPQPAQPRIQPGEEGYEDQQYEEFVRETASAAARINLATKYGIERHGQEKVDAALAWARERANADPVFRQQSWASDDPVAFAIEEQQRHEGLNFAAQLFTNPKSREQFQAWLNGQVAPQPAPIAAPSPEIPTPPRSLASAPAAGGDKPGAIPVHEGAAFDATFKR
jgi:hypothetical protein